MYSDIKELLLEGMNDEQVLNALADGCDESDRQEILAEINVIRQALENDSAPDANSSDYYERLKPNKSGIYD